MTIGDAEERVLRIIYLSIGLGGIVYLAVGFTKATGQFASLQTWWALTSYGVAIAGPIALALLARPATLRALRLVALTFGGLFFAIMLTFPWAQIAPMPDSDSPWTNDLVTIPVIAIAIGSRARVSWAYVIATGITSGVIRYLTAPEQGLSVASLDLLYNTFFGTVFVAITLVSRSSARRLDEAAAAAQQKSAQEAEATARVQQRIRIDALVHDHVLSALLIASRPDSKPTPKLRELAASTLATLRDDALPPTETLHGDDFVSRLRSAVSSQTSGIAFDVRLEDGVKVPTDVALALVEATAEAVRNSVRHADTEDRAANRTVSVRSTGSAPGLGIEISVIDDGRGFTSRRIPPERLGVRVSIRGRMETLGGGYADIESSRGAGTRVRIGWSEEPSA